MEVFSERDGAWRFLAAGRSQAPRTHPGRAIEDGGEYDPVEPRAFAKSMTVIDPVIHDLADGAQRIVFERVPPPEEQDQW